MKQIGKFTARSRGASRRRRTNAMCHPSKRRASEGLVQCYVCDAAQGLKAGRLPVSGGLVYYCSSCAARYRRDRRIEDGLKPELERVTRIKTGGVQPAVANLCDFA